MAGNKNSGGWNKAKVIDYSMLKRYSVAHLLKRIRSKCTEEHVKDKIALEVAGKDIGKTQVNNTASSGPITFVWDDSNAS
jgi:hypothetical protein